MRKPRLMVLGLLALIGALGAEQEPIRYPVLEGPYLGQKPPGAKGALFAPGFVSVGLQENNVAVAPDGKECYWTVVLWGFETILWSRLENGRWTDPEVAPFSGQYLDGWPAFRPDGRKLFFHSGRPLPDKGAGKTDKLNIWFADRTDSGWSEPRPVGPPVNGEENAACPSVTKDGTLYISKRFSDKSEKICRSALVDGRYQELEVLPAVINTANDNFHAFISPDETYLIKPYYGLKGSIGAGWNYYVSFRKPDGGWGELINLGPGVNSERCGGTPSLSPDGKYLFYQAWTESPDGWAHDRRYTLRELIQKEILIPAGFTNFNVYWVETTIIDALKPKGR